MNKLFDEIDCKCDTCKRCGYDSPDMMYPYPMVYCGAGHWEGCGEGGPKLTKDPWKDCTDYEKE
jgi:hypothetical protein